jgi:hypothetical protein
VHGTPEDMEMTGLFADWAVGPKDAYALEPIACFACLIKALLSYCGGGTAAIVIVVSIMGQVK